MASETILAINLDMRTLAALEEAMALLKCKVEVVAVDSPSLPERAAINTLIAVDADGPAPLPTDFISFLHQHAGGSPIFLISGDPLNALARGTAPMVADMVPKPTTSLILRSRIERIFKLMAIERRMGKPKPRGVF